MTVWKHSWPRQQAFASALVISSMLVACQPSQDATSKDGPLPAPAAAPVATPSPPPPPPKPRHFYAVKDGLEYGYEVVVSEEQMRRGQVTAPLMMFRFLGEKDGSYQVSTQPQGGVYSAIECERPCEFARMYTIMGERILNKETMRLPSEALLRFVFEDAMNGRLEQWRSDKKGKSVTLWVDGAKKKLVLDEAE